MTDTSAGTDGIFPLASLGALLQRAAQIWPERPFLVFPEEQKTYSEVHRDALDIARALIARGLKPCEHVAILMPNCVLGAALFLGTHLAGGVAVPINARFKRRELRHVLSHSDARFLFTTQAIREHVDFVELIWDSLEIPSDTAADQLMLSVAPKLDAIVVLGDEVPSGALSMSQFLRSGAAVSDDMLHSRLGSVAPQAVAYLLYTSGTTALPKGCELTHEGLVSSWQAFGDVISLREDQGLWTPCPFFHIGGIGPMAAVLGRGAQLLSMTHFTPPAAIALLRKHRPAHLFPAFPPLTLGALRDPEYRKEDFTFVKTVVNVAPPETQRLIQSLLPSTAMLLNDFGMTEAAGIVTVTRPDDPSEERLSSNGRALRGVEVRIVDPVTRTPVPTETGGEIQFRGINAFRAYYKDDSATAAAIAPDGWVSTGDMGQLTRSGALLFIGRLKDILKVGGENVAPAEIEAHLSTHPAVKLVQVVGRPDDKYGEVPVAFVERLPNLEVTADELIAHCRGHLASFKVPREVRFVTEWPMSATKIQKFRLRELLEPRRRA